MKKLFVLLILLSLAGCGGDNFQVSPVFEGQAAPHAGYNFGPDSYVQTGDEVKVSGVIVWIDELDPNDILEDL